MATLETQYKNYISLCPSSKLSFEEWKKMMGQSISNGLKDFQEKEILISIEDHSIQLINWLDKNAGPINENQELIDLKQKITLLITKKFLLNKRHSDENKNP